MGKDKKVLLNIELRNENIFERARRRLNHVLALLATAPGVNTPKTFSRGHHHCGPIGHGKACHVNHSQRERGNRRSAKRAARVRRRGK